MTTSIAKARMMGDNARRFGKTNTSAWELIRRLTEARLSSLLNWAPANRGVN